MSPDTQAELERERREGLTQPEFDAQLDALAEDAWEHYHDTWRRTR